jgi:hypothetical protein
MNAFRTHRATIIGGAAAGLVAIDLILHSQWFEFTPLPDDAYEFAVKEENTVMLDLAIQDARSTLQP